MSSQGLNAPVHPVNWWPQQESNLHLPLRRGLLYPFNYGAAKPRIVPQVRARALPRAAQPHHRNLRSPPP